MSGSSKGVRKSYKNTRNSIIISKKESNKNPKDLVSNYKAQRTV